MPVFTIRKAHQNDAAGMEKVHVATWRAAYQGEIYVLYVLPECQHQGVGRRLVAACVGHLIHQLGVETLLIWVMAENPYRKFYESLGGRLVREKSVQVGGETILDVGFGWEDIHNLVMK